MLWTLLTILVVVWLLGLMAHIGGALIHLLLAVALVLMIAKMLAGRRTV